MMKRHHLRWVRLACVCRQWKTPLRADAQNMNKKKWPMHNFPRRRGFQGAEGWVWWARWATQPLRERKTTWRRITSLLFPDPTRLSMLCFGIQ